MCAKIAVIGLGQGGACAAFHLLKAGHKVTVFEKETQQNAGYDWTDDIRSDIFSLCGMPMPGEDVYEQKRKWLFVSQIFNTPFPCRRFRLWKRSPCTGKNFARTLRIK